jgi:AcrR family transcriptional regulator
MAALECFTTRGFGATTIEDIRAKSGASVGSIYHHFGSKANLAAALYVEGLREYQAGFLKELRRCRSAETGIRAVVAYHLAWIRQHANWTRYLFQMREAGFMTAAEETIGEVNREFLRDVDAWFEPYVRSGAVIRLPPGLFTAIVLGPAQMFARNWVAGRTSVTLEHAARVLGEAATKATRGR